MQRANKFNGMVTRKNAFMATIKKTNSRRGESVCKCRKAIKTLLPILILFSFADLCIMRGPSFFPLFRQFEQSNMLEKIFSEENDYKNLLKIMETHEMV